MISDIEREILTVFEYMVLTVGEVNKRLTILIDWSDLRHYLDSMVQSGYLAKHGDDNNSLYMLTELGHDQLLEYSARDLIV